MKKSFFGWFLLLTVSVAVTSCNTSPKADEAWIEGALTGNSFSQIVLEELTPDGIQKIDSAAVIHDKFKFKVHVQEPGFYFLRFSTNNFISIVLEPGNKLLIKAPADSLGYPTELTGSPENQLLLELNHKLDGCYKTTDSLSKIFKEYQDTDQFDSVKTTIDSAYYQMFNAHKSWLESYIGTHPGSLTTIVAFYQTLGRRSFFSSEDDYETMKIVDQNLMKSFPKNKHAVKFHTLFLNQKVFADQAATVDSMLEVGNPMPSISLPNSKQKSVDVTQIPAPQKLLVFWNIQSMVDNPDKAELDRLMNRMRTVGISFDEDLEIWKSFINKEFKNFTHVIDVRGLQGEVAHKFNITATNIPYYILLDRQNRVIRHGKNLKTVVVQK